MTLDILEIVGPALVAGLMIALTHAPLGIEVLRRGIVFIDLAIAQAAGLGVVLITMTAPHPAWWMIQISALSCALIAALLFRLVEARLPDQQEAIIGCTFVATATLALLLLADRPHGGEEIQSLFAGQILFVTWSDVLAHAPIYATILLLWLRRPRVRQGLGFYAVFAVAVTSSVQLVGVFVVFSSLILPALAVIGRKKGLVMAWLSGLLSVFLGVGLSVPFDLPTGPMLVVAYMLVAVAIRFGRSTWETTS